MGHLSLQKSYRWPSGVLTSVIALIITSWLIISCDTDKKKGGNQEEETAQLSFNEKMTGTWISTDYISVLRSEHSPKKAQNQEAPTALLIDEGMIIQVIDFHEGIGPDKMKMVEKDEAILEDQDEGSTRLILADEDELEYSGPRGGTTYQRLSEEENQASFKQLVGRFLLFGSYSIMQEKGGNLSISPDGQIFGMEGIDSYEIPVDYYDQGRNFDLIELNGPKKSLTLGWKFNGKVLELFAVPCKIEMDVTQDNPCPELKKGKTLYRLRRDSEVL